MIMSDFGKLLMKFTLAAGVVLAAGQANAKTIKLGVIAGLSGPGTSYGIGIKRGAEMAIEEINAAGGINGDKIEMMLFDDGSNPAQSVTTMQRMINEDVDLIVGGWGSSQVLANMEVVERAGVPYIVVGATNPRITSDQNKWTFRVIFTDAIQATNLAKTALEKLGLKRIAIIHDLNDYGTGNKDVFVAALKENGVEPIEVQAFQNADKEFTAQLSQIKQAEPDAIAVFGTIPAAPAIMNQARDLGITAQFIGTGGLANENLISLAPAASDGTILTTYFHEDADEGAKAWAAKYTEKFAGESQPPRPILGAWEYRAIKYIAAPCLEQVGTDKDKLRECISAWKGQLFSVPGDAHFDATNQLMQETILVQVKGGNFQAFKP